jgi:hypothetical protein
VPYGTGPSFTPFPGISCQATIVYPFGTVNLTTVHGMDSDLEK